MPPPVGATFASRCASPHTCALPASSYAAIPSFIIVICISLHSVHADRATTFHFETQTGICVHDSAVEHSIDHCVDVAERSARCCMAPGRGYQQLGARLQKRLEIIEASKRMSERSVMAQDEATASQMARGILRNRFGSASAGAGPPLGFPNRLSHMMHTALEERAGHMLYGFLVKTPSTRGPTSVLNSVALAQPTAAARTDLLVSTPANTPTNRRYWVLRGRTLRCYNSEADWRQDPEHGRAAKLTVDLELYTVVECRDRQGNSSIALLPKEELYGRPIRTEADEAHGAEGEEADDDTEHKSWYLAAFPPTDYRETRRWIKQLRAACDMY